MVLAVGATGLVGAEVCRKLLERGDRFAPSFARADLRSGPRLCPCWARNYMQVTQEIPDQSRMRATARMR